MKILGLQRVKNKSQGLRNVQKNSRTLHERFENAQAKFRKGQKRRENICVIRVNRWGLYRNIRALNLGVHAINNV